MRNSRKLQMIVWVVTCFLYVFVVRPVSAGSIVAWGWNNFGQCNVPSGEDFVYIDAGYAHNLAIKNDGTIVGWGWNFSSQATPPAGNDYVAISAGNSHSLALKSDGSIVAWGNNDNGECNVPGGYDFSYIAAGNDFSIAITTSGYIKGWGNDDYNQITLIPSRNGYVKVVAGEFHVIALHSDGSIDAWGRNDSGQNQEPSGNDFIDIAAGSVSSLALKSDGTIVAWGNNRDGQCNVPSGSNFKAISMGAWHAAALKSDGSIVAWGDNSEGQCDIPTGNDFSVISTGAGGFHNIAISGDTSHTQVEKIYIKDFDQFPAYPYNTVAYKENGAFAGCGPTTGAMIFAYFEHVYSLPTPNGLLTNPDQGVDEGLNTAWILHGSNYMDTNDNGFGSQYKIKSGLEGYASDRGYGVEVVIHVSPTYSSDSDSWDDYGDYGDAWTNDGYFWQENPGGDWEIDADDFCDFADSVFALNIPLFLTIDTDMDQSGDHWIPMVGYDRNSEKYAFYDTYNQNLQWADIHYALAAGAVHDNAIVFIRTAGYVSDENLPPAPPSNLQAHLLNDQIHITWQDNSNNETDFALEVKEYPGIFPIQWRNLDTLMANTTSYQMDNPIRNHTYNFRVSAFNDQGISACSNIDTLNFGYSLIWISISAPNGDESWSTGSTQQITWSTSNISPPFNITNVTIEYSTDGASNWISPAIASNVPNTGSYSWTVPNTSSTNCIVKVKNVGRSLYDLSNHSFTITTSNPPVLAVTPTTLDFGTTFTSLDFNIENQGETTLTWSTAESPDKSWITSISPGSGSNDATVTVTVDRSQLSGNSDIGAIAVTSNGGNQNVTVNISKEEGTLPDSWDFTSNTGNNATVVLPSSVNPNIDGTSLFNGDYIGAFTSAGLCCGYSQWQGQNISIPVWGDNDQTPETDGFQGGELINYRVYRTSEQKEWTFVTVDYSQGTGTYSSNGVMILSQFDVSETKTIALDLAQGWNMFSINVNPDDPNIETVMNPIVDKLVIVKNGSGQTYIPSYGINDIGNINFGEGYQAYLNQAATLDVTGQPVDPATGISLPAGWSMITYLPAVPMDVATALASISDQLVIAKNNAGQTYIPHYGIDDIGQMQPGQGYQVYMSASGTLTYPQSGGMSKAARMLAATPESKGLNKTRSDHFQFTSNTGENVTIVIPSEIRPKYSDDIQLINGDEIGVFTTNGLCCGAVVWKDSNAAITAWGNNSQSDSIDGFTAGDTLHFRVWQKSIDVEYTASVDYRTGDPCVYQANGFSVLTRLVADLTTEVTDMAKGLIPSNFKLCQNYPNPFNMETTIEYQLPKASEVMLTIYDTQGHIVCRLIQGYKSAGSYTVRWGGYNQSGHTVASGIYFCRIMITEEKENQCSFSDIKKIVLIK